MRLLALTFLLLLAIASARADKELMPSIVELPRPNSETFSFSQAEARKFEILSNASTAKLEKWKNPYLGFCIHIATNDTVTIYGHWGKANPDLFPEYEKARINPSAAEVGKMVGELPLYGNPAGVLVTSDKPLRDSRTIRELLKVLFVPSVQLFYARSSEPDGAANRSQPIRSETNQTSPAAGSRR